MSSADPETLAAVDLGSNSFHMVVAHLVDGQWRMVDRVRDQVQLAAGLGPDGKLSQPAQRRAKQALRQFRERLRDVPASHVRAVGTNTLRRAKNGAALRRQFEKALGTPIELISGREEARLIYLGVAHDVQDSDARRLVVDIGGGSTECILGEQFEATDVDSLHMGCVSFSRRFFEQGRLDAEAFEVARVAAELELQPLAHHYRTVGWESCVGASGTIKAVESVIREAGWSKDGITSKAMRKLVKRILQLGHTRHLHELAGLESERMPVFAGGVAILSALFHVFGIDRMRVSQGALREGVLYDLQGRFRHEDVRQRTIERIGERFHVDREQNARIETTALRMLEQLALPWSLSLEQGRQYLRWAARLHTIGLAVAFSGYHKHGAYLIANADLPGFSREDQQILAALVRTHRRKLSPKHFESIPAAQKDGVMRLALILRMAVRLHRGHHDASIPASMKVRATKEQVRIFLPKSWWKRHPLTRADFETEVPKFRQVGVELVIE